MNPHLDLRFVGVAPSQAVADTVRRRIGCIERICPEVQGWRVTVEREQPHQHPVRPFAVRVDVSLPGHEVGITRIHDDDVHVAVRNAFDATSRKMEDRARMRGGEDKQHTA